MPSFKALSDWSFQISGIAAGIQLGRTGSCKVTVPVELAGHWSEGQRVRANDVGMPPLYLEVTVIKHHNVDYLELTLKIAEAENTCGQPS